MRCFRFPILCSLIIILGGSAHTKPLPDLTQQYTIRHLIEDDNESNFTEKRKEEFLRSLNLSQVPKEEKPEIKPPQFMIDLYNRYVTDKNSMPASDIVRSFMVEDVLLSSSLKDSTQSHILQFNVSVPWNEEINKAEIKIYISFNESHTGHLLLYDVLDIQPSQGIKDSNTFLESKEFKSNQWVTIDVTRAVQRWVKSKKENNKYEVFLKLNSPLETPSTYNFTISGSNPPFLIVFSDDKYYRKREITMDMRDKRIYEQDSSLKRSSENHTLAYDDGNEQSERGTRTLMTESKRRLKRSVKSNSCRKIPLIVNIQYIGWDSWLLAPKIYDAGQCKGECYHPLTDDWTPTNHAIVQTLMHQKFPQDVKKPCCVPTKLEAIQVLYMQNNVAVVNNNYKEMKVTECGCR
uniref:TGF-beta family profile domain-containing protein n=1 Tax=Leptobrachium leishanense TaxID=445787 RepID=A0A8C5QIS8_9ANUR